MKYFRIFALIGIIASVIVSCSDDASNPTFEAKNYFVFSQNNTWTYRDSSYTNNTPTITNYDARGVGKDTVMNRYADAVAEQQREDQSRDTNYYYVENKSKLYTSLYFILPKDLSAFGISGSLFPNQWILVADQENASWKIIELPIDSQTVSVPGYGNVKLKDATLAITGSQGGTKTFTVDSKQLEAKEFNININLTGTATFGLSFDVTLNVVSHLYFAENVGFVGYISDASSVNLGLSSIPIPGSSRILTSYTVAVAEN